MLVKPADVVARAKATINQWTVADASERLNADTLLIDVRESREFATGHLSGAICLPRGLLEFEIHGLVEREAIDATEPLQDRAIVLYCGTGGRSALAAETLGAMGYRNVSSMDGGLVAWKAAGLPIED